MVAKLRIIVFDGYFLFSNLKVCAKFENRGVMKRSVKTDVHSVDSVDDQRQRLTVDQTEL